MYQFENAIYILSPDRRCLVKVASGSGKRKNWKESTSYTDDRGRKWEFNTSTRRWGLHPDDKKPKGKKRKVEAEFEQYLKDPGDPELKQVFGEVQDASDRFDQAQDKIRSIADEMKSGADDPDQFTAEDQRIEELSDSLMDGDWSDLMRHMDEISEIYDRKFARPPYTDADPPIVQKFETDFNSMNNILPFDLTSQRQVREVLNEIDTQLVDLTNLSAEARAEAALRGFVDTMRQVFEEVKDGQAQIKPILEKLNRERTDRLERSYEGKGRISRDSARIAALQTRIFHTLNPRKIIRVPAGTTQAEYAAIVQQLIEGDKKAIKQYTARKPAVKKRNSKRNP